MSNPFKEFLKDLDKTSDDCDMTEPEPTESTPEIEPPGLIDSDETSARLEHQPLLLLENKPNAHNTPVLNAWIDKSSLPLVLQQIACLKIKSGEPVSGNLLVGDNLNICTKTLPTAGLETSWTLLSNSVEFCPSAGITIGSCQSEITPDLMFYAQLQLWIAKDGSSKTVAVSIKPKRHKDCSITVLINAGHSKELHRCFELNLEKLFESATVENQITTKDQVLVDLADLNLKPAHEWMTPPYSMTINIMNGYASLDGTVGGGQRFVFSDPWTANEAATTGPIHNIYRSLDRFRNKWSKYLDDIDSSDLVHRLQAKIHESVRDWSQLPDCTDEAHKKSWDAVARSDEFYELAFNGYSFYNTMFPTGTRLRTAADLLQPGQRVNINCQPQAGWPAHLPLGLAYCKQLPKKGEPIDPLGFWAFRYRVAYIIRPLCGTSKALGALGTSRATHVLYWGTGELDQTGQEASWQRTKWQDSIGNHLHIIPSQPHDENKKNQITNVLQTPQNDNSSVIYLYCQCDSNDPNQPTFYFANDAEQANLLHYFELGQEMFPAQPLTFANACATISAEPYLEAELPRAFLTRGCRAYIGTEQLVPIKLGSRLAYVFFHFFYRQLCPEPIAAGEALAQTRLFLWTHYRNVGGLFYTLLNEYELFMADKDELQLLRN